MNVFVSPLCFMCYRQKMHSLASKSGTRINAFFILYWMDMRKQIRI